MGQIKANVEKASCTFVPAVGVEAPMRGSLTLFGEAKAETSSVVLLCPTVAVPIAPSFGVDKPEATALNKLQKLRGAVAISCDPPGTSYINYNRQHASFKSIPAVGSNCTIPTQRANCTGLQTGCSNNCELSSPYNQ